MPLCCKKVFLLSISLLYKVLPVREIYLVYVWFLHAHVDQGNKKVKELAIYFFFIYSYFFLWKKEFSHQKKKNRVFLFFFFFGKRCQTRQFKLIYECLYSSFSPTDVSKFMFCHVVRQCMLHFYTCLVLLRLDFEIVYHFPSFPFVNSYLPLCFFWSFSSALRLIDFIFPLYFLIDGAKGDLCLSTHGIAIDPLSPSVQLKVYIYLICYFILCMNL